MSVLLLRDIVKLQEALDCNEFRAEFAEVISRLLSELDERPSRDAYNELRDSYDELLAKQDEGDCPDCKTKAAEMAELEVHLGHANDKLNAIGNIGKALCNLSNDTEPSFRW